MPCVPGEAHRPGLLLLVAALAACSAPPVATGSLDLERAGALAMTDVAALVRPYVLEGRTPEGLALLDAWLALEQPDASRAAGHRLRADALIDLWIYAQVAEPVDPEAAARARTLLVDRLPGPVIGGPQANREALAAPLAARVAADYEASGAPATEQALAVALVSWDPTTHDAGAPPEALVNAGDDPRSRFLLAGALLRNDARHRQDATSGRPRLSDVAWLCGGSPDDDIAALAERCGFWCADLPERAALTPTEERDLHELGGDDTPVEVDQSPFEPEAYAEYLESTEPPESPWFPTPGDLGYELVTACGADYFGLPAVDGVVLLSERSYLDLVYLSFAAELLGQLELDLLRGEPLVVLASDVLGAFADGYTRDGLPQALTPAATAFDARLELPPFHAGPAAAFAVGQLRSDERLLLLRSDAVSVAVPPRLRLERHDGHYRVAWAESDNGYHYPGLDVVEMARLNRLDDDQVSDDRIPLLRRDLEDLERLLAASSGVAEPGDGGQNACGGPDEVTLAVLADGSTYFETLRPALKTALDCGYARLDLVALEPATRRAVPLAFEFVTEPLAGAHQLELELARVAFRPWVEPITGEVEPFRPPADDEEPLLTLYRHLSSGLQSGAVDPGRPLLVTVLDERVDAGSLLVALQAVLYRREGEPTTDAELLAAPPLTTPEGTPQPLFPGGIIIHLR